MCPQRDTRIRQRFHMSDDETYLTVCDENKTESYRLMLLRWHQMFSDQFSEQPSAEQVKRLDELELTTRSHGPPEPKPGQLIGYQVYLEVEQTLGLDWFEELTRSITPWSKFAHEENQPIYHAYATSNEGTPIWLWDHTAVITTLFNKRIIYLELVGLIAQEAIDKAVREFNSFSYGIPQRHCEQCENLFHPGNDLYGVDEVYFYLQRKTCSDQCSKIRRWQKTVLNGMLANVEFDKSITWEAVWERFGPNCYICGMEAIFDQEDLRLRQGTKAWKARWGEYKKWDIDRQAVVEHVHPRSKGGSHTWDNVRIACNRCNLMKSDSVQSDSYGNDNA